MRRVLESPVLRECETENRRIAGAEGNMSVELKGLRFYRVASRSTMDRLFTFV